MQLQDLMGESGAGAVQALLARVREPAEGLTATAVGLVLLFGRGVHLDLRPDLRVPKAHVVRST